VLAFFGFVVTTFRRFRDMEVRYTRLARRIALDEAPPVLATRGTQTPIDETDGGPVGQVTNELAEEPAPESADRPATPPRGGGGLRTGAPERLAGSPRSTPSLKAADAD